MRLGLVGPAHGNLNGLERAVRFLLGDLGVDRVVYLGVDQALDVVVRRWAEELVAGDPSEGALWERATERCLRGSPEQIDQFVQAERQRRALQALESLPGQTARTIEILEGKLAVLIHDKDDLEEEDMLFASFLVFGLSAHPVLRAVGRRWFISPGSLEHFGIATLEERPPGVELVWYDCQCREVRRQLLTSGQNPRLRVGGGPHA